MLNLFLGYFSFQAFWCYRYRTVIVNVIMITVIAVIYIGIRSRTRNLSETAD